MSSWGRGAGSPALEAPQYQRSRVVPETVAKRATRAPPPLRGWSPGCGFTRPATIAITQQGQVSGPQTNGTDGAGGLGRDARTPGPAAQGRGGPDPALRPEPTGGPSTSRRAATPPRGLALPPGLPERGCAWPPPAATPTSPRLTQKTKLKTKSRYLMHLVQPSTPMAARAAGGLRGAGRSWAAGARGRGAGRAGGPDGQGVSGRGEQDAEPERPAGARRGRQADARPGWRRGRRCCFGCALALWPGARPVRVAYRPLRPRPPQAPPPQRSAPLPLAPPLAAGRGAGAAKPPSTFRCTSPLGFATLVRLGRVLELQ